MEPKNFNIKAKKFNEMDNIGFIEASSQAQF